jgi:hypothetical protein
VLLSKDDLDPRSLIDALSKCRAELSGDVVQSRRARRTLVRIDDVATDFVDAFVPAWNPNLAIRFPISLLPAEFQATLKSNQRFFAKVNTDAEKPEDLFLEAFEPAPEVDETDDIF